MSMILQLFEQTTLEAATASPIDCIIVASGYEKRAVQVAERVSSHPIKEKYVVGFREQMVLNRHNNDDVFKLLGYVPTPSLGDAGGAVADIMEKLVSQSSGTALRVVVDYSCMTRIWYASILNYFAANTSHKTTVEITFAYSPALFSEPGETGPNTVMGPMAGYCGLQMPDRESALVVGLGYERDRAIGLVEYIEASKIALFLSDPALNPQFTREVRNNNYELIRRIGQGNTFSYPFTNLAASYNLLASVCLGLGNQYRVILAPLGPKPFSLLCLILAKQYKNIDVWRVSTDSSSNPQDRIPEGSVLCCKTTFAG